MRMRRVCIVGASGKLGQYTVRHSLDRRYEVVGVCREGSVRKFDTFKDRITIIPGATNDRDVVKRRLPGVMACSPCLQPGGWSNYASGTAVDRGAGQQTRGGRKSGAPVWSRHVGDPVLASNLTRRVDFALFLVAALDKDELVQE